MANLNYNDQKQHSTPFRKVALLIVFSFFAFATKGQWESTNGPTGGEIYSLASTADRLFAGTVNGLFFSDNAGVSWQEADLELTVANEAVYALAAIGDTIVCGADYGIYRSVDNGMTWQESTLWGASPFQPIQSLHKKGNRFYAGSHKGVFYSDDGGVNWYLPPQPNGLPNASSGIFSIASEGTRLFVSLGQPGVANPPGVFVSENEGLTWSSIMTGLPQGKSYEVTSFEGKVYAGINSSYGGVFILQDTLWAPLTNEIPDGRVTAFCNNCEYLTAAFGSEIYQFINGNDWSPLGEHDPSEAVGVLHVFQNNFFAGTARRGVLARTGNILSPWVESNTGISVHRITELEASESDGIWAQHGAFQSFDHGAHWHSGDAPFFGASALEFADDFIFLAFDDKLLRSADGGLSWQATINTNGHHIEKIESSGSLVVAMTYFDSLIFISNDFGENWDSTLFHAGSLSNFGVLALDGQSIYLGSYPPKLWVSHNAGVAWDTLPAPPGVLVSLLANGQHLIAGTSGGMYQSFDGGLTWFQTMDSIGITDLRRVGPLLFFSAWGYPPAGELGGVFVSFDNATTWIPVNEGFPALSQLIVEKLAADEKYLYASLVYRGIWRLPIDQLVPSDSKVAVSHPAIVSLFPNPAGSIATLRLLSKEVHNNSDLSLFLFDARGKEVYRTVVASASVELDRGNLPSGLYYYVLFQSGQPFDNGKLVFTD
jgi:photosystem II stability/assembly factor-like uncharacterized protein